MVLHPALPEAGLGVVHLLLYIVFTGEIPDSENRRRM